MPGIGGSEFETMWAPFSMILGASWAPFWTILGSKTEDFGVWGRPGGRLGAMLDPMAGQRGPSGRNWTKRLTLGTPFWGPFSALFAVWVGLFCDPVRSRFLDGFWARFGRVLGSFF